VLPYPTPSTLRSPAFLFLAAGVYTASHSTRNRMNREEKRGTAAIARMCLRAHKATQTLEHSAQARRARETASANAGAARKGFADRSTALFAVVCCVLWSGIVGRCLYRNAIACGNGIVYRRAIVYW
jgi:hypothetical protein